MKQVAMLGCTLPTAAIQALTPLQHDVLLGAGQCHANATIALLVCQYFAAEMKLKMKPLHICCAATFGSLANNMTE
jgi:hypothetical protein